jgi:pimeloyl-ACP methyl ester carboxylesterase
MAHALVGGRPTYYELHGERPGVPLVLVMGMAGSCQGWHALQVPELSKQRRLLLFDHRGVGETPDPGGPFSVADLADDLVGLLDALGIERADLLGAFMGGMAAQEAALRHPERVERLVLVGSYARPDAKRRLLLEHWRDLARLADFEQSDYLVRERLLWTLHDETLEQTDLIEAMVRFFRRDGAPLSADLFARQCDACLGHDTLERLPGLDHPTLVLGGREDLLTPPRLQRQIAGQLPNARLVLFSNAGHLVMAEAAQRFNESVLHFLGEDR